MGFNAILQDVYDRALAHQQTEEKQNNTLYAYMIMDNDLHYTGETGVCRVLDRNYDPCYDDVFVGIEDIDTGEYFYRSQFLIRLKKID